MTNPNTAENLKDCINSLENILYDLQKCDTIVNKVPDCTWKKRIKDFTLKNYTEVRQIIFELDLELEELDNS